MRSQVSFKFDGEHNKPYVLAILSKKLNNVKHKFEKTGYNTFRIYVAANNTENEVMNICRGIQCFAVLDPNVIL